MGQPNHSEALFYYSRMENYIPQDHLLRRVDQYIDFAFIISRRSGRALRIRSEIHMQALRGRVRAQRPGE